MPISRISASLLLACLALSILSCSQKPSVTLQVKRSSGACSPLINHVVIKRGEKILFEKSVPTNPKDGGTCFKCRHISFMRPYAVGDDIVYAPEPLLDSANGKPRETPDIVSLLQDIEGNGEKRFLLVRVWEALEGPSALYYLDSYNDFAIVHKNPFIPAGEELLRLPKYNPSWVFPEQFEVLPPTPSHNRLIATLDYSYKNNAKGRCVSVKRPVLFDPGIVKADFDSMVKAGEDEQAQRDIMALRVFVYCYNVGQAKEAAAFLKGLGFTDTEIVKQRELFINKIKPWNRFADLMKLNK